MNEVGLGLVVAAVLYGFRHGFDLDHLAAIGDIAGSSANRRRAIRLSTYYVAGHALVVSALGALAVAAGAYIPEPLDGLMGRVVGATLMGLGLYLGYSVIRYRGSVRLRSRWMLAVDGARAATKWIRRGTERVVIEHSHHHSHAGTHDHAHAHPDPRVQGSGVAIATATHTHVHKHVATVPVDPFKEYSAVAAFGVGMIHGIGAETPSQVLLFASAAGAGSAVGGMVVLIAFVIGLVVANTVVAIGSAVGLTSRRRFPALYAIVAGVTAVFSLALGTAYLVGRDDLIPGLLGI